MVTDLDEVKRLLASKASSVWGQGPIGDTGYFFLASPTRAWKAKRLVMVCETGLVAQAENETAASK